METGLAIYPKQVKIYFIFPTEITLLPPPSGVERKREDIEENPKQSIHLSDYIRLLERSGCEITSFQVTR